MSKINSEAFQYAIENGIIQEDYLLNAVEEMKNKKIIEQYPYKIWRANDGRFMTYLTDETKRYGKKLIAKKTEEKLYHAIIDDYNKTHAEANTVTVMFHKWMEFAKRENTLSLGTIDRYTNDFVKYIANTDFANKDILKVQSEDVQDFLKSVMYGRRDENKLTLKCYTNIKIVVNGIFTFAKSELKIQCVSSVDAMKNVKIPKRLFKYSVKMDSDEVFDEDEIKKLSSYITNEYYGNRLSGTRELGILFLIVTGLRMGELVTLKYSDVEGSKLYIQRTESHCKGENGHNRLFIKDYPKTPESMNGIELSDTALLVWKWLRQQNVKCGTMNEYVFYEEKYGRLHEHHFKKVMMNLCNYAGVKYRSLHKLRKTYASMLFAYGVEEKIVQNQLRHKDSSTTHGYYEFCVRVQDYRRAQINKADIIHLPENVSADLIEKV